MQMSPRQIGVLGYDGVAAIDLAGVVEAFAIADGSGWRGAPARYATCIVGLSPEPFRAESGVRILPDVTLDTAPPFDTIVVPGGEGLREEDTNGAVAGWLRQRASGTRRVVSVCTGLYGLAASGLLDGRRATTHWRHAAAAARRFPKVTIEPDAIFIKDGAYYSSAGMTASIDLALGLIEEDHGPALALATARQLVVYMKRSGGQMQYSELLRFQTRAGDQFAELVASLAGDLAGDWSVETMARQVGLSSRQFSRRFKANFDMTPAGYLEALRLDEARLLLSTGQRSIAWIAHMTGFQSDDAFRRAFERRFRVSPGAYRDRFTSAAANETTNEITPQT